MKAHPSRSGKNRPRAVATGAAVALAWGIVEGLLPILFPAPGWRVTGVDALWVLPTMALLGGAVGWLGAHLPRLPAVPATVALLALLLTPLPLHRAGHSRGWSVGVAVVSGALAAARPLAGVACLLSVSVLDATTVDRGASGEVAERQQPAPETHPDVVLVTVDTLRADAGFQLPEPERWLQFEQAVSPSPWTLPSFLSLFTGEPVIVHRGGLPRGGERYTRPGGDLGWLPAVFAAQGYRTTAWICNPYLRRERDFDRGFARFIHADAFREPFLLRRTVERWRYRAFQRVERLRHTRDERLVELALREWARDAARPRFGWLHLLSPHEYARDPARPVPGWRPGMEDLDVLRRVYRANVGATEALVARFLQGIDPDRTVVAFTSDHGEAFGEPGYRGHGRGLSEQELRVPLALRAPGLPPGRVAHQVATRDLGRTLLALAGLDVAFPGRDLRRASRDAVAVGGVRRDADRFARRLPGGEQVPVAAPPLPQATWEPDPETLEALRAFGYVESGSP